MAYQHNVRVNVTEESNVSVHGLSAEVFDAIPGEARIICEALWVKDVGDVQFFRSL